MFQAEEAAAAKEQELSTKIQELESPLAEEAAAKQQALDEATKYMQELEGKLATTEQNAEETLASTKEQAADAEMRLDKEKQQALEEAVRGQMGLDRMLNTNESSLTQKEVDMIGHSMPSVEATTPSTHHPTPRTRSG